MVKFNESESEKIRDQNEEVSHQVPAEYGRSGSEVRITEEDSESEKGFFTPKLTRPVWRPSQYSKNKRGRTKKGD